LGNDGSLAVVKFQAACFFFADFGKFAARVNEMVERKQAVLNCSFFELYMMPRFPNHLPSAMIERRMAWDDAF
jgi:hypothetical protein